MRMTPVSFYQEVIFRNFISEWFKANKLTLNIDKTYYMVCHRGRRKLKNNIELVINDMKIREAKSMKYLGGIIDSKLNWIVHITYIKNKVAKGIGLIRKAQKLLNQKALLNLYHNLIFPYLIYCVEIWGCAKKTHLSRLYLLQKRIVRIIMFLIRWLIQIQFLKIYMFCPFIN